MLASVMELSCAKLHKVTGKVIAQFHSMNLHFSTALPPFPCLQIVGVMDSGIDMDSCYFWDPEQKVILLRLLAMPSSSAGASTSSCADTTSSEYSMAWLALVLP